MVETDGETRRFRTRSSTLTDGRGQPTGRIVYLNDVTDLVEREQRISVLNRILRHNVRNELNVVCGQLDLLAERVGLPDSERVESARRSARQVVAFAEKARAVERVLQASDAVVSATAVVEQVIADAPVRFADVRTESAFSVAPGGNAAAHVRVVDSDLLETALGELVENAVVHNDHDDPRVCVRVETDGDWVQVHVADNGSGIPPQETRVLDSPQATHLEHGSGLGLWLVKWTVSLSAGELSFATADGNVVTVTLPAADSAPPARHNGSLVNSYRRQGSTVGRVSNRHGS